MSTDSTLPRRALVGSAWATPVVLVGAAAPAYAASAGVISAVVEVTQSGNGARFIVTVRNTGTAPSVVSVRLDVDTTSPMGSASTGPLAAWTRTDFGFQNARKLRLAGTTTAPLGRGASLVFLPLVAGFALPNSGTATVTLSAPAPAVVVQPAPVPFAYAAAAPAQRTPAETGTTITVRP